MGKGGLGRTKNLILIKLFSNRILGTKTIYLEKTYVHTLGFLSYNIGGCINSESSLEKDYYKILSLLKNGNAGFSFLKILIY